MTKENLLKSILILWILGLVTSGLNPHDRLTWWLEIFPVILAMPILWLTRCKFELPTFLYLFIFIHGLILMAGGHYTYAETPLGEWLKVSFHFQRNHFDRIGHFMQGFVPALIAREILIRRVHIQSAAWTFILSVSLCMSISVTYEFIEWWAALILGQGADAFLGTQGDPWDTQWDMFLATVGAIIANCLARMPRFEMAQQN